MTVGDARSWVRQSVSDGDTTGDYTDTEVDRSIQYAVNYFVREAKYGTTVSTVNVTAADTTPDISALVTAGFTPERLLSVHIDGQEERLQVIDAEDMNHKKAVNLHGGNPQFVAFNSATEMELYPTPSTTTTMKVFWYPTATSWTLGDAGASSTVINIPNELLISILQDGAAAVLVSPSPDKLYGDKAWQKFVRWTARRNATGSLTPKTFRVVPAGRRPAHLRRLDQAYEEII